MKKIIFISVILIIVLSRLGACGNGLKYDQWKDTIEAFGDGTYQLLHQNFKGKNEKILTNCKYNECVATEIEGYEKTEKFVYFKGKYYSKNVYCKLDAENNILWYFAEENGDDLMISHLDEMISDGQMKIVKSLDEFSDEDIKIFNKI